MSVNNGIINNIRKTFLTLVENNEDLYHKNDVQLVKTNDWWIERYVLAKKSEDSALRALVRAMKWRKSFGVNDFTDDYFPEEIYKIGIFNTNSLRDKDGRRVLLYTGRNNSKSKELAKTIRQFFVYCIEKLEQQTSHEGYGVICDATGMNKLNVEFKIFMTEIYQRYYPLGRKYLLVVNTPLIIKTPAEFVVQFMNEEFRNRFKFINENKLTDYLSVDFIPTHLNGNNKNSLIEVPAGVKQLDQLTRTMFTKEEIEKIYKTFNRLKLN